jgi:uncharacterized protein (TIGR00251 family)
MLDDHPDGFVLPVRVQPGARKVGVLGERDGALKIAVAASAEHGRANAAVLDLLRDLLGLRRSEIELLSGPASRDKKFLIRGVGKAELQSRLARLLA